jgi:hypothetical protein
MMRNFLYLIDSYTVYIVHMIKPRKWFSVGLRSTARFLMSVSDARKFNALESLRILLKLWRGGENV